MAINDSFTILTKQPQGSYFVPNIVKYHGYAFLAYLDLMIQYIRFPQFSTYCTLMMNSNFPNGLSIFHSSYPSTFRSTPGSLDTHVEGPNFLSAEAQDEAIAKYGIAGRVWYKPLSCSQLPPTEHDATGKRLMP